VVEAAGILATLHLALFEFVFSFFPSFLPLVSMNYHAMKLAGFEDDSLLARIQVAPEPWQGAVTMTAFTLVLVGIAVLAVSTSSTAAARPDEADADRVPSASPGEGSRHRPGPPRGGPARGRAGVRGVAALALPRLWSYATGAGSTASRRPLKQSRERGAADRRCREAARQQLTSGAGTGGERLPDATLLGRSRSRRAAWRGRAASTSIARATDASPARGQPEGLLKARPALCRGCSSPAT
jgi:hypothetical protein